MKTWSMARLRQLNDAATLRTRRYTVTEVLLVILVAIVAGVGGAVIGSLWWGLWS